MASVALSAVPITLTRRSSSSSFPPPPSRPLLAIFPSDSTPSLHLRRTSRRVHGRGRIVLASASSSAAAAAANGPVSREHGEAGLIEGLKAGLALIRTFLPGGSWWRLDPDGGDGERVNGRKKVSMVYALRRMWSLVAEDRLVLFAAFGSLVLAALSDISIPNCVAASIFSAQTGESMIFYRNAKLLVVLCFTSGICCGLRGCCFGIANMLLVKRMREMLYSSLLFQDVSFFDEETVGDLTSRLGADCQQVSRVIGNDLNLISRYTLQGIGALIYLIIICWPLALSAMLICAVLSAILFFYGRYQKESAKLTQEFTACANDVAQETFSLMRTVRVYGTEKHEFGRYTKWLEKLYYIGLRQSLAYGFWNFSFSFTYHFIQVVAVLIGGISMMSGHLSAEQLTKFILYTEWLIYATWAVGDNWSSLMQSIGASEKVFQLMDLLPSGQFLSGGLKLQKLIGRIEFVNVSFKYPARPTVSALQNVNLVIHPHEVLAIVGLSGSGKSSLVNLLLRLYEPSNGQIFVDGTPLGDLDIKWLRERTGLVGQEPRLFHMDVSSNIRYGCTREVDHKEVEWAAKQAFAHEFILSLPNGYATLVDNSLLSGGQKQRIAIARAILRDPTFLILDEATSALDAESEHYVKGVLRAVQNRSKTPRTVIVIAHRLSTIQAADRIVVMDSGRIVEMGNHNELIQKDGLYAQLAKRQTDVFA